MPYHSLINIRNIDLAYFRDTPECKDVKRRLFADPPLVYKRPQHKVCPRSFKGKRVLSDDKSSIICACALTRIQALWRRQ